LFAAIGKLDGNVNEAFQKAFIGGLQENNNAQAASWLTVLMSSPFGKFATKEHCEKFGEKVDLLSLDKESIGELFAAIGRLEENENHDSPPKAFMEGLLENSSAQDGHVFAELMSSSLGKFATNEHWEKFGEKVDLWSLNNKSIGELFAVIGRLEENENHNFLPKDFIAGLVENPSARSVSVLTILMSSPFGKFATNTHLEKLGEKADLERCYIEDVEKLFAAIGRGEEAKERKKAFQKGVWSNSKIDIWLKRYINKFMEEGK
jgi:hypothetical protein